MSVPQHFVLIDDSPADQVLAQEAFGHLCPECTLRLFSSGAEALGWLRQTPQHPDVILLDVNMPVMNGFEVLQELKRDPELALIPVVMLSTSSAHRDVASAYTLHASSYMVKAPGFGAFVEQIDTFLSYWRAAQIVRG